MSEKKNPAADGGARTVANAGQAGDAEDTTTSTPIQAQAHSATSVGPHGTDHRESFDAYRGELLRFGQYRVATCRHGIQWIYQRQRPGSAGVGAVWDTLGYCSTREALKRLHRSYAGADAIEIADLPERIGLGCRR